jgi:hypothetical protein
MEMTDSVTPEQDATTLKREQARLRKQKQRARQKEEAVRKRQQWDEANDPVKRWERNRVEREAEYQAILQRQQENLEDCTWLESYAALLKAGKEPDVEDVLNVAASALLNIEEYGFDDHLYCPTEWLQEFTFAYESALRTGKNVEYYEFGVSGLRVPRELWTEFVELAGAFIRRLMPDWESDETARRVVAAMKPPAPTYDKGAMRECPSCRVAANATWVSDAIWNEYEAKGIRYRCHQCRDAERQSRAQTTGTILGTTCKDTIFDGWGRVKT